MKKTTLMKLILIVLLVFAFFITFSVKDYGLNNVSPPIKYKTYSIRQIIVNSGHEFELLIEDDDSSNERRIWAFLDVKTSDKAKDSLIRFFNSSSNPRCCLKSKKESYWVVDIFVTNPTGVDVNIVDFLEGRDLVFN